MKQSEGERTVLLIPKQIKSRRTREIGLLQFGQVNSKGAGILDIFDQNMSGWI